MKQLVGPACDRSAAFIRFQGMSDIDLVIMRHKVIKQLGQSVPCERDQW